MKGSTKVLPSVAVFPELTAADAKDGGSTVNVISPFSTSASACPSLTTLTFALDWFAAKQVKRD